MEKISYKNIQLITKILVKELFSGWRDWDKNKDFYLSKLFPSLLDETIKSNEFSNVFFFKEQEIVRKIKNITTKNELDCLENFLDKIYSDHCSIEDLITEVRALVKNGEFIKSDELFGLIKDLPRDTLSFHEYEKIKESRRLESIHEIEFLLKKFKFDKARSVYNSNKKIIPNYNFESYFTHLEKINKKQIYLDQLNEYFNKSLFLEADAFFEASHGLLSVNEYEEIKSIYIKQFFKNRFPLVNKLSNEQFLAIADTNQSLLLRARAGSGKTTTLSTKISYLINCEKIEKNKIVALCFNSSAAKNIIKKLHDDFNIEYREKENITTFHSLAGQISPLNVDEETLFDDRNPLGEQKLTSFVEQILNNKWKQHFHDLEKDEISDATNSIYGFLKKILVKIRYATYEHVVYAIAREYKRFDTDDEMDELRKRGILFGSKEHYLYRRNLSYITLDGKHVKSFGEKCIADYLFEHDIRYQYESNFRMNDHTYYPDFNLYNNKIIIEHWGIDEFDKNKKAPINWSKTWDDYVKEMGEKRAYWESYTKNTVGPTYKLLETNITQLRGGREVFEKIITNKLQDFGIINKKLPIDEIISRLSHNLKKEFSKKLVGYIQKAKQGQHSPGEMRQIIDRAGYSKHDKEYIFLILANIIYKQYEDQKKENKKIDFYDYLLNAEKAIITNDGNCILRSGINIREIKWLLIDEFQDFSPLFMALIKAIQKYNPSVRLFCVGDDWQAINSFAGSDVSIFNGFEKHFPINSAIKNLTVNWRSNQNIVNFGNKIMSGYGIESSVNLLNKERAIIEFKNINDGSIEINVTKDEFGIDTNVDVVLLRYLDRVVKIFDAYYQRLKENHEFKVLILSRTSFIKSKSYKLDDLIKNIKIYYLKKYPDEKQIIQVIFGKQIDEHGNEYCQMESKTAHQSKGLEANVVIVLEATNRRFPLIHPDYQLFEIFGDTLGGIEDEERRLFYVACTRTKSDLYLLYEEDFDKKKTLTEFYS